MKGLIKIIKHDAEIFGGVSDSFFNKREQDEIITYMKQEKKIPDYYYFEIKNLFKLHSPDILTPEERTPIYELFNEKSNLLVKRNNQICINHKF